MTREEVEVAVDCVHRLALKFFRNEPNETKNESDDRGGVERISGVYTVKTYHHGERAFACARASLAAPSR
jgi:hypothetical protein